MDGVGDVEEQVAVVVVVAALDRDGLLVWHFVSLALQRCVLVVDDATQVLLIFPAHQRHCLEALAERTC